MRVAGVLFNSCVFASVVALVLGVFEPARSAVPVSPQASELRHASNFKLSNAPYGAFGGGSCKSTRTPVVFIHGNGDFAGNWNSPASTGGPSVIAEFKAAGYTDCDLFGVSFLSPAEQDAPQNNYHRPDKAEIIASFVRDVMAYTKSQQVDIVSHSLGVTMSLYAIDETGLWSHVRRFVGIAGGLRGLYSCVWTGFANAFSTTCAAQNLFDSREFGFWPDGVGGISNPRIGDGPESLARIPKGKKTLFYTIRAGIHDEAVCKGPVGRDHCITSPMFFSSPNVKAQLNVGAGEPAPMISDALTASAALQEGGDQNDGVGHVRAKTDTGAILLEMLTTACAGRQCCGSYDGKCGN